MHIKRKIGIQGMKELLFRPVIGQSLHHPTTGNIWCDKFHQNYQDYRSHFALQPFVFISFIFSM